MADQIRHEDNDTPTATIPEGDDRTKKSIEDTPHLGEGSTGGSLENGVRSDPKWSGDDEQIGDPKSAGTPVHPAPTDPSQS
jgi:hypothetical protein